MDEVDEFSLDSPALETHAAQIAANQTPDGSTAGSNEASAPAAAAAAMQRRNHLKITPKPTSVPMTPVPEEPVPHSDADSYRSAEETERAEEQSEPPPEE
eukprot:1585064-Amphidinium_carterae.1